MSKKLSTERVAESDLEGDESSAESDARESSSPLKRKQNAGSVVTNILKKRKVSKTSAESSVAELESGAAEEQWRAGVSDQASSQSQDSSSVRVSRDDQDSSEVEAQEGSANSSTSESAGDESESDELSEEPSTPPEVNASNSATVGSQRERPGFSPPPGFVPTNSMLDVTDEVTEILQPENLKGKQLWHFTAPAAVPLSGLKSIDLDEVKRAAPILFHDGIEYGFVQGSSIASQDSTLLRLSEDSSSFAPVPQRFEQTFHLQQMIPSKSNAGRSNLPSDDAGDNAAVHPVQVSKEKVEQPTGLRNRYWPPGFEPRETRTSPRSM